MANIQVKNVPDSVHERLRRVAREQNTTLSAVVLSAVEHELTWAEWQRHWEQQPTITLGVSAAELIAEARAERDAELEARIG